jgi:L-fuconolactonase
MTRRDFLLASGSGLLAGVVGCASQTQRRSPSLTIIDCHTHFYDPGRPEGVPWPGQAETQLYRTVRPADYLAQPVPTPVTGTVVVEASPWVEDNRWILDLAAKHDFIVGFCGNLNPSDDSFTKNLNRFAANPLYRGIRIGGGGVAQVIRDRGLIAKLGRLADLELELDVNLSVEQLPEVGRLAREIPRLRIVIDHLANTSINGRTVDPVWLRNMQEVSVSPNVFAKVSGLVEGGGRVSKLAPTATEYYAPWLDMIWSAFGEDRLIYGSNWPVSELYAPLFDVQRIVEEYFSVKGRKAMEKVFAGNASAAYRWRKR